VYYTRKITRYCSISNRSPLSLLIFSHWQPRRLTEAK